VNLLYFLVNKGLVLFLLLAFLALPLFISAQVGVVGGQITLDQAINRIINNIKLVFWVIAATIIVITFVLAGFKYLTAHGESSKVSDANKAVIWGLAGTVTVVLAWSVLSIIQLTLGV
jgi:hypothetical protein